MISVCFKADEKFCCFNVAQRYGIKQRRAAEVIGDVNNSMVSDE